MMKNESQIEHGTALIIEDNEDNRLLISEILKQGGYRILLAETGRAGVELAVNERPDLVILDIQLPDIDGLEVLRRIRASEADGSLPVIAMTSFAMAGDEERLIAAGCNGYIEKPIDPMHVLEQIRVILREASN